MPFMPVQIFIQAAKSEEDFLICPKLPKMNQKLLNGELNELSEFFFQCFDLILFRGAFCKFSCYGSNIVCISFQLL